MPPTFRHRSLADFSALSVDDAAALVALARSLQRQRCAGSAGLPLKGKNLAVVLATPDDGEAAAFERVAAPLGARVACLCPGLSERSSDAEVQRTAALLGRLYDAVDCVRMAPALVQRVNALADIPVFEGITSSTHPIGALAELLDPDTPVQARRCLLIQAVLIRTLN